MVASHVRCWSFYTVTNVWKLAWADSALVVLGEWSSYRGGRLNRFDCNSVNPVLTDVNQSVLADIRLFLSLLKIMVKI